jgi:uncharacterized protein involved in exopolysaccharide biosynthesis
MGIAGLAKETQNGERNGAAESEAIDWTPVFLFLAELRRHLRLLAAMALVFVLVAAVRYATTPRSYMAVAVIGPPDATSATANNSSGGTSGIARSLFGGGSAANNDRYQKFLQLLRSTRLVQVLIDKHHIDRMLFLVDYQDQSHKGAIARAMDAFKGMLGMPASEPSRVDTVAAVLNESLGVDSANSRASSLLTGTSSIYSRVTFSYSDPRTAEAILNLILEQADDLIRQDVRQDVTNRLTYLQGELPRITVSDLRDTTIATLSTQRQLQMMTMADKHFAADQIDPPHASDTPTYPKGPGSFLIIALALALFLWSSLVFAAMRIGSAAVLMARIESVLYFRHVEPYTPPSVV